MEKSKNKEENKNIRNSFLEKLLINNRKHLYINKNYDLNENKAIILVPSSHIPGNICKQNQLNSFMKQNIKYLIKIRRMSLRLLLKNQLVENHKFRNL